MYSCVLLNGLTLFLRNRWYQTLLNDYSWEDVIVSLMQKTLIYMNWCNLAFMSGELLPQNNWRASWPRSIAGNIGLFICMFNYNRKKSHTGWLLRGIFISNKPILPFHLPVNSWTNNPTKWSGVSHLQCTGSRLIYSSNESAIIPHF